MSVVRILLLWVVALMTVALRASPSITHFAPHALIPGKKTVLTFSGSGLQTTSNLWLSAGGVARRVANTNEDLVSFELACPEDAHGIQALQLSGPAGASSFQLILIDSLRTQPHSNTHQSRTNAHRITPPAAVDCILKPEQVDYYRFSATAGEAFSIEVIAHRIGSDMDPVVHVFDMNERELVSCDDEPGVWRDSRFVFVAPSAGDYLLAVNDAAFGGGPSYDYRLRVTHDPLVWYTYPLVDPSEPSAAFETAGSGAARESSGSPANPQERPGLGTFPALAENEPNDAPKQAQQLFLPCILNGKINASGDTDYFRFHAGRDEKIIFQTATRSLGSPCDLVLVIKNFDGNVLAQSDPALASDAAVTNKFSEPGEYLLEVRELSGNSPPNVPYRIKMAEFQNGVTVSAEANSVEVKPGGVAGLKVTSVRYDYPGEIHFEIEPPIAGLSLEASVIPEKKNEGELKIKGSDHLAPGFLGHFKLKAVGPGVSGVLVSTKPALRKSFPLMLNSPSGLEGLFSFAVKNE